MKRGDRIELVHTGDPYTNLKPGDRGTVAMVDSMGTVHVRWDNGSNLGLVPGEDAWKRSDDDGPEGATLRV
jgi:hypothetical protein